MAIGILFIGGGNMATALIAGLLRHGIDADRIAVVDHNPDTRDRLAVTWSLHTWSELNTQALAGNIVVLAVKPQQLKAVAQQLAPWLKDQVVLSIAAGVRTDVLIDWLEGYSTVVRAMPNTPAMIGAGMTGLFAPPSVNTTQRELAQSIMRAAGETLWLEQESMMDAVTAVSGSGPAYVFYFMEAMEQAALALGLSAHDARQSTLVTFAGAAKLAGGSNESPRELRQRVTSPGGTTESAILSLQTSDVSTSIVRAIEVAAARSAELGNAIR